MVTNRYNACRYFLQRHQSNCTPAAVKIRLHCNEMQQTHFSLSAKIPSEVLTCVSNIPPKIRNDLWVIIFGSSSFAVRSNELKTPVRQTSHVAFFIAAVYLVGNMQYAQGNKQAVQSVYSLTAWLAKTKGERGRWKHHPILKPVCKDLTSESPHIPVLLIWTQHKRIYCTAMHSAVGQKHNSNLVIRGVKGMRLTRPQFSIFRTTTFTPTHVS